MTISRGKGRFPFIVPLLLAAISATSPASAQSSIGFVSPNDVEALLDYALPTWSYRTWTINGSLSGSGREIVVDDDTTYANAFASDLTSLFEWQWMSDTDERELSVRVDGRYAHHERDDGAWSSKGHSLEGTADVDAAVRHYLSPGEVWGGLSIAATHHYSESVRDHGKSSVGSLDWYGNSYRYRVEAEVGAGRVRDVTPIIRAQRLGERLRALGRTGLSGSQVRRVADVLAREWGYRNVFDRSEKNFWSDVIEPILAGQEPLTPYEILYLRDVMVESLGTREQGSRVGLVTMYTHTSWSDEYEVGVFGNWGHNVSLAQQFTADAYATYCWNDYDDRSREYARFNVRLAHLWTVADRYDMRTSLTYSNDNFMPSYAANRRAHFARLEPQFRIYIEDSLALVTSAAVDYISRSVQDESRLEHGWSWRYGISLEYALDRVLY